MDYLRVLVSFIFITIADYGAINLLNKGNVMKKSQLIFLILTLGMSINIMAEVTDKEKFCVGGEGTQLAMNLCSDESMC